MKVILDETELDTDIKKLVKDRIRNFMRNDEKMSELIREVANEIIDKKVEASLSHIHISQRVDRCIQSNMPPSHIIASATMKEIKSQVERVFKVDDNADVLATLLKPEIEATKVNS